MTISEFAHEVRVTTGGWSDSGRPLRQQYREKKRLEAQERQAAFDAEVERTAREQNCGPTDARYIVNARRRHEHHTGRPTPITLARVAS